MSNKNGQAAVSASYFLFRLHRAYVPYVSIYLSAGGWSGVQIGIFMAIGPLVTFLTQPLWGYLGDLWGNLPRLCALLVLLAGASALTFAFLPVSPLFFALALLMGLFQGPVSPMLDSMGVRILGQSKNRWGLTRLWGSIGFAAVTLAIGRAFAQNAKMPLVGYAVVSLLTMFAVLRLPFQWKPGQAKLRGFQFSGLANVLRGPFLTFLGAMFLLQLGHFMQSDFLSLVMTDRCLKHHSGLAWSSTAGGDNCLPHDHPPVERYSAERLVIGQGLNRAALVLLPFLQSAAYAFVHGIKGITTAAILVSVVLIVDRLVPEEYHATGFTLNTAFTATLPQFLAGLIGGRIYDAWGGTVLFLISAAAATAGTALCCGCGQRKGRFSLGNLPSI